MVSMTADEMASSIIDTVKDQKTGQVDIARFSNAMEQMTEDLRDQAEKFARGEGDDPFAEENESDSEDERLWDEFTKGVDLDPPPNEEIEEEEYVRCEPPSMMCHTILPNPEPSMTSHRPDYDEDCLDAATPSMVNRETQSVMEVRELIEYLQEGTHSLGGGKGRSVAPLLIDVRDGEFSGGSIKGAVHSPHDGFDDDGVIDKLCESVHKVLIIKASTAIKPFSSIALVHMPCCVCVFPVQIINHNETILFPLR